MAFTSIADLITALDAGKTWESDFRTNGVNVSGNYWIFNPVTSGSKWPVATSFPGTALACVNTSLSAGDGTNTFGLKHGPNVSTDTKYLIDLSFHNNASGLQDSQWQLIDLVSYWPGINLTTLTAQNLTGTPTLTRWPNGNGLRLAFVQTAITGAADATGSVISYTNQAGTAGQTSPQFNLRQSVSLLNILMNGANGVANCPGPSLALASGDFGVRNVASVTLGASMLSGTAALILYKPIFLGGSAMASGSSASLPFSFTTLPKIPDDACLCLISQHKNSPNSQSFNGSIRTVWG